MTAHCDYCGQSKPLTIRSEATGHVLCSACVWACADRLVEHGKRGERRAADDAREREALGLDAVPSRSLLRCMHGHAGDCPVCP